MQAWITPHLHFCFVEMWVDLQYPAQEIGAVDEGRASG